MLRSFHARKKNKYAEFTCRPNNQGSRSRSGPARQSQHRQPGWNIDPPALPGIRHPYSRTTDPVQGWKWWVRKQSESWSRQVRWSRCGSFEDTALFHVDVVTMKKGAITALTGKGMVKTWATLDAADRVRSLGIGKAQLNIADNLFEQWPTSYKYISYPYCVWFYGTISLGPVKAKFDFTNDVKEVVRQFTAKLGVDVSIDVVIQAHSKDNSDESQQQTIKENYNVLMFIHTEFEEE